MAWVPTLYFCKGLPYVILMTVSLVLYKQMGLTNAETTFYTAWLHLPWVLKPMWQPFVAQKGMLRWWILGSEILTGAALAGVALTLPAPFSLQASLALFWLAAFSCAVHNYAADELFLRTQGPRHTPVYWTRTVFYRLATFAAQGILVMMAGNLQVVYRGSMGYSWSLVLYGVAGLSVFLWIYHGLSLPAEKSCGIYNIAGKQSIAHTLGEVADTTKLFFRKPAVVTATLFMLLYRLPEGLLSKVSVLFVIDASHRGGLGLSPQEYGLVAGTVAVAGLSLGGLLGAMAMVRGGLRRWLWPMAAAMSLPNIVYLYLSHALPDNLTPIALCLFIEQLGYGFGFVAYMMFIKRYVSGYLKAPHLTLAKSLMALSMMLPGMLSGWVQSMMGYREYFLLVVASSIATLAVTWFANREIKGTERRDIFR